MNEPIRMCLSCRQRYTQKSMVRLQQQDADQVIAYQGYGRSFYLCHDCIMNTKKIRSVTKRLKQDEELFVKLLKELSKDG